MGLHPRLHSVLSMVCWVAQGPLPSLGLDVKWGSRIWELQALSEKMFPVLSWEFAAPNWELYHIPNLPLK